MCLVDLPRKLIQRASESSRTVVSSSTRGCASRTATAASSAALGEISTLAELDRKRMFHTPDLRQERGMLSFEARNRSRGVTLDRAGLLQ